MKKSLRKISLLALIVSSILFMPTEVKATVVANQGTIIRTSSNNASLVMGADLSFYRTEINSTHAWMDQTYSAKHYTRYSLWVTSPNDVRFTVNSWFATKDSTGTLAINTPADTNIGLRFHSPNLISASATGVVSNSWNASNQTLSMVANSGHAAYMRNGQTIIISATVNETEYNHTPENVEVTITDLEGCGDWVFSQNKYYTFQAQFWDGDGYDDLAVMKIAFSDGLQWINASYNTDSWSLDSGSDYARIRAGTTTVIGENTLQVTYQIYLLEDIADCFDVDIYMYCQDDAGEEDDWQLMQTDYFNIYNLGGHSTLTTSTRETGTLGHDTKGSDSNQPITDRIVACEYGLTQRAYISSINVYIYASSASESGTSKCAIYDDTTPLTLIAETEELTISTTQDGWMTFDFSSRLLLDGLQNYWLAVWSDSPSSGSFRIYKDDGGTNQELYNNTVYTGSYPDPLNAEGYLNYMVSIYASWTSYYDCGRLDGGDVFDIYAWNGTWVEVSTIFRELQHVKMLPEVTAMIGGSYSSFDIYYSMDYCTDEDEWIEGWEVQLHAYGVYVGSVRSIVFNATWYNRGVVVDEEDVYFYHTGVMADQNTTFRFWVDLWFNKINASSTVGGRVNAYYFPMKDSANAWLIWLTGSNWGINDEQLKETMMFTDLLDADNNVLHTPNIKLVRVGTRLEVNNDGTAPHYVMVKDYDVFDLAIGTTPFEGVQTPVFDETRVPVMPQGGFLGSIVSGLRWLGEFLADHLLFGGLNIWGHFVNFMDTLGAYFGYPNWFSDLLSYVNSFFSWLGSSIGYLWSLLLVLFNFLSASMTKFISLLSQVFTNFISIIQGVLSFFDGAYTAGINVWDDLGMSYWVMLIAILYPIYLVFLWEEEGLDAVINQLRFIMDVLTFFIRGFISVLQMVIDFFGRLIEAIPVIE